MPVDLSLSPIIGPFSSPFPSLPTRFRGHGLGCGRPKGGGENSSSLVATLFSHDSRNSIQSPPRHLCRTDRSFVYRPFKLVFRGQPSRSPRLPLSSQKLELLSFSSKGAKRRTGCALSSPRTPFCRVPANFRIVVRAAAGESDRAVDQKERFDPIPTVSLLLLLSVA